MRKQIYSNDEKKVNVVVLSNGKEGILVKGISKCSDEDTYDRETGIKLANSRAWLKYYDQVRKNCNVGLEWLRKSVELCNEEIQKLEEQSDTVATKWNEINEELAKMEAEL